MNNKRWTHPRRVAVDDDVVVAVVATQILSGEVVIGPFMQLGDAPENAIDVEQAVVAFWRNAAHQGVQVGRKLVVRVLRAIPLIGASVVVPDIV